MESGDCPRKPMTAAERQQKRRQKLKDEGAYEEYKKKHVEEVKRSRQKQKKEQQRLPKSIQKKMQVAKRLAGKMRVRAFRARKKETAANSEVCLHPENSPKKRYSASALGKATARARRSLPSTPRRKMEVVRRLYILEVNSNSDSTIISSPPTNNDSPLPTETPNDHLSSIKAETVALVEEFYQRDDVSRQAPGRKDAISVKQKDGSKCKVQVRHLMNSITETYHLFQTDHPEAVLGRSKFAQLRPKHVLLSNKLPHNVCLCKYHDNFINAINILHQAMPTLPAYTSAFPETIVCDPVTENCWYNRCGDCKDGLGFRRKYIEIDDNVSNCLQPAKWYVWKSDNSSGRIQKVIEEGTIQELIEHICDLAPTFLEHCHVKRHQAKEYHKQRYSMAPTNASEDQMEPSNKTALIQVDFAENFTCKYQDEIQSAHWQQNQVSLFTAAIWYSGKIHPCVIASDDLTHSKDTVIAYMDKIFEDLPADIGSVNIWSDGPASQFKNRFIAAGLCVLQKKYQGFKKLNWNFFATSHGKGPVDGIGGSVKRQVWSSVNNRRHIVVNAASFVAAAKDKSNVMVLEMTPAEIQDRNKALKLANICANAPTIPGISKVHLFVLNDGKVSVNLLTNAIPQAEVSEIKVGDWYFVEYNGQLYPGEVKMIGHASEEYVVQTMEAIGKYWRWPRNTDSIYYTRDKLIQKLMLPVLVNSRGHFSFTECQ